MISDLSTHISDERQSLIASESMQESTHAIEQQLPITMHKPLHIKRDGDQKMELVFAQSEGGAGGDDPITEIVTSDGQVISQQGQIIPEGAQILAEGSQIITSDGGQILTAEGGQILTKDGQIVTAEGGHIVTTEAGQIVTAEGSQIVTSEGGQIVTADGSQIVMAEGSQIVTAGGDEIVTGEAVQLDNADQMMIKLEGSETVVPVSSMSSDQSGVVYVYMPQQ